MSNDTRNVFGVEIKEKYVELAASLRETHVIGDPFDHLEISKGNPRNLFLKKASSLEQPETKIRWTANEIDELRNDLESTELDAERFEHVVQEVLYICFAVHRQMTVGLLLPWVVHAYDGYRDNIKESQTLALRQVRGGATKLEQAVENGNYEDYKRTGAAIFLVRAEHTLANQYMRNKIIKNMQWFQVNHGVFPLQENLMKHLVYFTHSKGVITIETTNPVQTSMCRVGLYNFAGETQEVSPEWHQYLREMTRDLKLLSFELSGPVVSNELQTPKSPLSVMRVIHRQILRLQNGKFTELLEYESATIIKETKRFKRGIRQILTTMKDAVDAATKK